MLMDMLEALRRPQISQKLWMKDCELILGTRDNLDRAIDECINAPSGTYGLDTETTGLDLRVFNGRTRESIVGVCLAPTKNKGYYFPIAHQEGQEHNVPWRLIGPALERLFDLSVEAQPVFHNAGFDQEVLEFNGYHKGLGEARWDSGKWHDTYILKYLLDPRTKGGRGLKHLSKELLEREMIELDDLMPDSPNKNYSKIDPSWEPCKWYGAADAMCTLALYEVLNKQYTNSGYHTNTIYALEKSTLVSVRWVHRNRVYVDQKTALRFCQDGQKEWFDSLLDVYKGASDLVGRDILPNYIRILKGDIKGLNRFDHTEVGNGYNYKIRVDEARKEADRMYPDIKGTITKSVRVLSTASFQTDEEGELEIDGDIQGGAGMEDVDFPIVYDLLSPQQLGLLFRELQVPNLIATEKSGQVATSGDVLDEVIKKASESFPFMDKVKRYRMLGKSLGQYLIPFVEDIAEDGTLMPKFDQFAADTGRFSCKTTSDPKKTKDGGCRVPFQGIPATYDPTKPECISNLRKCIAVRHPDWYLAAIDYSGVELRLVTNLSGEPKWIKAFFECSECGNQFPREMDDQGFRAAPPPVCICGSDKIGDLHTITAVAFYGEASKSRPDWKALRGNGKACNFALSYGGTGKAVQRSIGCNEEEGNEKYKVFTKTYDVLTAWWDHQHQFGRKNGYVKTAMGRVQPLPSIKDKNFRHRSKDERKAVNGPVQGTSADVTKLAMSLIYKTVKKNGWLDRFKMILTVHDEIVFEIHKDLLTEAIPVVCEIMTRNKIIQRMNWDVPLLVDVELGKDWTVPDNLRDIQQGEGDPELIRIFGGKKPEPKPKAPPKPAEPPKPTYELTELSEKSAQDVAYWIKSQAGLSFVVKYQGRDISALFRPS